MPFKIFVMIVVGVIAASAVTVWIASAAAIYSQFPAFLGLGAFILLGLAASLLIRKFYG